MGRTNWRGARGEVWRPWGYEEVCGVARATAGSYILFIYIIAGERNNIQASLSDQYTKHLQQIRFRKGYKIFIQK